MNAIKNQDLGALSALPGKANDLKQKSGKVDDMAKKIKRRFALEK